MYSRIYRLASRLKGTILHPQWLSDRCHYHSRKSLRDIRDSLILDVGSGASQHGGNLDCSNSLLRLDYPATNSAYACTPGIYADVSRLPVRDQAVDVVLLLEVLEHVQDERMALREIFRVLKPGGRLYLSVPFVYPLHDVPNDYRRFTIYGLRWLLTQAGFTVRQERQHGHSILTTLQMINLVLLEMVRDLALRSKFLGVVVAALAYPVCLACNLLALPVLNISWLSASCFGYFLIAERS